MAIHPKTRKEVFMSRSIKMSILNLSLLAGLSVAHASGRNPDSVKAAAAKAQMAAPAAPAAVAAAPAVSAKPESETPAKKTGPSASRSCDDLKIEIDGKLKAKGVKAFTLDILPKADMKSEKVIGNCEGGAKVIVYKRG